jgi:hypothetical protein
MFKSYGNICLRNNALVVEIDQEIGRYYFSQLKQNYFQKLNKPRYDYHITIIGNTESKNIETISNKIEFYYLHEILFHDNYFYIKVLDNLVFSNIRENHNLDPNYDLVKGFHITIANIK